MKLHSPSRLSALSFSVAILLICGTYGIAQDREVLCREGAGTLQAEFSGVTVRVGASRIGGLSTRTCEATLRWDQQTVIVAADAAQIDLDAFGVDLGLGVPVAAFQVKNSASQCCVEYELYSLEKHPRLVRTITGGDFFSAADTDLDGRIEIWTTDASAVNGFEKLDLSELDSAPTIVLRFEHGELLDASPEFQTYFDSQIARLRNQLRPEDLRDFKTSYATVSSSAPRSAEQLHRLRRVKIKILEIVWDYLYSGRETQAWNSLTEMWPDGDIARIRAAIVDAHTRGLLAQAAGVSTSNPRKRRKRVTIFDVTTPTSGVKPEITSPEPILLRRPPPQENQVLASMPSELLLELTIDSAGKVRSAGPVGKATMDDPLLHATAGWKFIPALNAGRPVASRTRLAVSLRQ